MPIKNLLDIDHIPLDNEDFSNLYYNDHVLIERIVSFGQVTEKDQWLEQEKNEWVAVLRGEAEILFQKGSRRIMMKVGDHFLIPSHSRHRVTFTSDAPPCIWLAVHF